MTSCATHRRGVRAWRITGILLAGLAAATADAGPIAITNGDFEAVAVTTSLGYAYQPGPLVSATAPQQNLNASTGIGWTFAGLSGLTHAGSNFNPPSFSTGNGANVAFIQGGTTSTISQTLTGFTAGGTYTLSFTLGSRFGGNSCCTGDQTIEVLFDGAVIATFALVDSTPFAARTVLGTVSGSDPHTLLFRGTATTDETAFFDNVRITANAVPAPPALALLLLGGVLAGLRRPRPGAG